MGHHLCGVGIEYPAPLTPLQSPWLLILSESLHFLPDMGGGIRDTKELTAGSGRNQNKSQKGWLPCNGPLKATSVEGAGAHSAREPRTLFLEGKANKDKSKEELYCCLSTGKHKGRDRLFPEV